MAKDKFKLQYKVYYHSLFPSSDGLICFGSNEPGHPEGSCINPNHSLAAPNLGIANKRRLEAYLESRTV